MPKTKLEIIRPFLAVNSLPDGDLLPRLISAHDGVFRNPAAFPNTPFDEPAFKGVIDRFATAAAAVVHDGGKVAVEERNKCRADAVMMYRILGHYVEVACKNDMNTFVSSGFTPISKAQPAPPQPLDAPQIDSIEQGQSGRFIVTIKRAAKALYHELSYGPLPAGGGSVEPTTIRVPHTGDATDGHRRSDQWAGNSGIPVVGPAERRPAHQGIGGMMNSSNAMKKGRLLAALNCGGRI